MTKKEALDFIAANPERVPRRDACGEHDARADQRSRMEVAWSMGGEVVNDVSRRHWIPRRAPGSARVVACTDPRVNSGRVLGAGGLFVLVDLRVGSWARFDGRRGSFEGTVVEILREKGRRARVVIELTSGARRRVLKNKCAPALRGLDD